MKTVDLTRDAAGVVVTLELSEFELTALAALVEQGQRRLNGKPQMAELYDCVTATANEFRSLLGSLELLAANE